MWYRDSKLDADYYFWGQCRTIWHKNHYFMPVFGPNAFRNSFAMAKPKVPGDQKLFERVCYMFKLKVTKFQLPTPNGFWANLPPPPPPSKIGLRIFTFCYILNTKNDVSWQSDYCLKLQAVSSGHQMREASWSWQWLRHLFLSVQIWQNIDIKGIHAAVLFALYLKFSRSHSDKSMNCPR